MYTRWRDVPAKDVALLLSLSFALLANTRKHAAASGGTAAAAANATTVDATA